MSLKPKSSYLVIIHRFEFRWLLTNILVFCLGSALFGILSGFLETSLYRVIQGNFQTWVFTQGNSALDFIQSKYSFGNFNTSANRLIINIGEEGLGIILVFFYLLLLCITIASSQYLNLKNAINLPKIWIPLNLLCLMVGVGLIYLLDISFYFLLCLGLIMIIQWVGIRKKVRHSSYWVMSNVSLIFVIIVFSYVSLAIVLGFLSYISAEPMNRIMTLTILGGINGIFMGLFYSVLTTPVVLWFRDHQIPNQV
jgi:hypothetical protein